MSMPCPADVVCACHGCLVINECELVFPNRFCCTANIFLRCHCILHPPFACVDLFPCCSTLLITVPLLLACSLLQDAPAADVGNQTGVGPELPPVQPCTATSSRGTTHSRWSPCDWEGQQPSATLSSVQAEQSIAGTTCIASRSGSTAGARISTCTSSSSNNSNPSNYISNSSSSTTPAEASFGCTACASVHATTCCHKCQSYCNKHICLSCQQWDLRSQGCSWVPCSEWQWWHEWSE